MWINLGLCYLPTPGTECALSFLKVHRLCRGNMFIKKIKAFKKKKKNKTMIYCLWLHMVKFLYFCGKKLYIFYSCIYIYGNKY